VSVIMMMMMMMMMPKLVYDLNHYAVAYQNKEINNGKGRIARNSSITSELRG
jgi:hypothetical protein